MPKNQLSIWSEIIDVRNEKSRTKYSLTDEDITTITRLFRGEHSGINLHKLKGTHPTVYSAYVNKARRLLFIPKGTTLALVEILPDHNYDDATVLRPGVAEKLYQKPWDAIKDQGIDYEPVVNLTDFIITQDYQYEAPQPCLSYYQQWVTLDDQQRGSFSVKTPVVIIGDPGSGKSLISSAMMAQDLNQTELLDDERWIVYFSESQGLAQKMENAWLLDHPITARKAEANQIRFLNYADVLAHFLPADLQGLSVIGEPAFYEYLKHRLENPVLLKAYPFLQHDGFKALLPCLYHEFQIIAVCPNQENYISGKRKANLPLEMRVWAHEEYMKYTDKLKKEGKHLDPNLMLWEPTQQPFARVYHDEALSASPAINLMLKRLTLNANIIYFADPNQENTREMSDLDYIKSDLAVNGRSTNMLNLSITYRLPKNIAQLANAILTIKQNLNGGKNEKNQSSQVVCQSDEQRHPGSLQWVNEAEYANVIDALNEKNVVYTVITHPEYLDEARALFGNKTYVCSIDESRGQEFTTAILYRVTDPKTTAHHQSKHHQGPSLLQQVNKQLKTLDAVLTSKTNLAKSEKLNRRFEAYMNSIYIAVTRIAMHGYLFEKGKPTERDLHHRLQSTIAECMKNTVEPSSDERLSLETILANAEDDFMNGRIAQAKAGYLRAGKTEDDFNALVKRVSDNVNQIRENVLRSRSEHNNAAPLMSTTGQKTPRAKTPPQDKKPGGERPSKANPAPAKPKASASAPKKKDTSPTSARSNTDKSLPPLAGLIADFCDSSWVSDIKALLNDPDPMIKSVTITELRERLAKLPPHQKIMVKNDEGLTVAVSVEHYLYDNHPAIMNLVKHKDFSNFNIAKMVNYFKTPYYSTILKQPINLITLIGIRTPNRLYQLIETNPTLIKYIDWHFTYPVAALENSLFVTAFVSSLQRHELDRMADKLTSEPYIDYLVTNESIAKFIEIHPLSKHKINNFEALAFATKRHGLSLVRALIKKFAKTPRFSDYFTIEHLASCIESVTNTSSELAFNQTQHSFLCSRLHLYITLASTEFTLRLIETHRESDDFFNILLVNAEPSSIGVKNHSWNGLSSLMTSTDSQAIMKAVISAFPRQLSKIAPIHWHAPAAQDVYGNPIISVGNYAILRTIQRCFTDPLIINFFNATHQAHLLAAATIDDKPILTTLEILKEGEKAYNALEASKLMASLQDGLFAKKLANTSNYPLLNGVFGDQTVLAALLSRESYIHEFLEYFAQRSNANLPHQFNLFLQENDINQLITTRNSEGNQMKCSLFYILFESSWFRKTLESAANYDPRGFSQMITVETLLSGKIIEGEAHPRDGLLIQQLVMKAPSLLNVILRHIKFTQDIPTTVLEQKIILNPSNSLNLLAYLIFYLLINHKTPHIASEYCNTLIYLLELSPNARELLNNSPLKFHGENINLPEAIQALKQTLTKDQQTRLTLISHPESEFSTLLQKHWEIDAQTKIALTMSEQIKRIGINQKQKDFFKDMLTFGSLESLNALFEDANLVDYLSSPVINKKTLALNLLEHPKLRAPFIDALIQTHHLKPELDLRPIFTCKILNTLITIDGHEKSTYFFMMEDDKAYQLYVILHKDTQFLRYLDTDLLKTPFYSERLQATVPAILFMAIYRLELLSVLARQFEKFINKSLLPFLFNAYLIRETENVCVLSCLLTCNPEEAFLASSIITSIFTNPIKSSDLESTNWRATSTNNETFNLTFDTLLLRPQYTAYVEYPLVMALSLVGLKFLFQTTSQADHPLPRLYYLAKSPVALKMTVLNIDLTFYNDISPKDMYHGLCQRNPASDDHDQDECHTFAVLSNTHEGRCLLLRLFEHEVIHGTANHFMVSDFKAKNGGNDITDHQLLANWISYRDSFFDSFKYAFANNPKVSAYIRTVVSELDRHCDLRMAHLNAGDEIPPEPAHQIPSKIDEAIWLSLLTTERSSTFIRQQRSTLSTYVIALGQYRFQTAYENYLSRLSGIKQAKHLIKVINENDIHAKVAFKDHDKPLLYVLTQFFDHAKLIKIIFEDASSRYNITKRPINVWLSPCHSSTDKNVDQQISQLDLILANKVYSKVGNQIISKNLKLFLDHCKNENYLFTKLALPQGDLTRFTVCLRDESLHFFLLIYLKQPQLPIRYLAEELIQFHAIFDLAGDLYPETDTSMIKGLQSFHYTESGCRLLNQLKSMRDLLACLPDDIRLVIESIPPTPVITSFPHSMFQQHNIPENAATTTMKIKRNQP